MEWSSTGLTWTANQQVALGLTIPGGLSWPQLNEQTLLTATLTVDADGVLRGCDDSSATMANCSARLTTASFTHETTANTVAELYGNTVAGSLELALGTGIDDPSWRRLTLHLDGESYPLANASKVNSTDRTVTDYPFSTWTDGQRVQVRLTARPWTGVVLESAGFVPNSTGRKELIVPEGGSATFGVKLSTRPTANVTVNLVKSGLQGQNGDANAATVSPTTLTFTSSNYSSLQTVTVTGVADSDDDHEHLMILPLVSSTDSDYGGADATEGVHVTVSDGAAGPVQVGAWPGTGRESGNGRTSNATLTVWLNRSSTAPVAVSYRTVNGTARAGSDYRAVAGSLQFAPGDTRKTVQVQIIDDNVEDSGETFWLELSNPQGASLEPDYTRALVEILNDEAHLDGLSAEGAGSAGGAVRGAGHRRVLGGDDEVHGDGAARDDARAAGADDGGRGPDAQGGQRIGSDPGEERRGGSGGRARGRRQRPRREDDGGDGCGEDLLGDGDPRGAAGVVERGPGRADGGDRRGRQLVGAGHRDVRGGRPPSYYGHGSPHDDARAADGDSGPRRRRP